MTTQKVNSGDVPAAKPTFYGSVSRKTKKIPRLYGSVNGSSVGIGKLYGSVNGKTKLVGKFHLPPQPAFIETLTYMQDCANYSLTQLKEGMVVEKPYTLIDKRDNTKYTIALLKDTNIWMCENLRIIGYTCKPEDTDITSGTFLIPNNQPANFKTDASNIKANHAYLDSKYGGYYTWYTTCAGRQDEYLSMSEGSICPKGWELPNLMTYSVLATLYGEDTPTVSANLRATPVPGFTFAGGIGVDGLLSNQGKIGYYWWNWGESDNEGWCFGIDSSTIAQNVRIYCASGVSVRGLCKGNRAD